MSNYFGTDLTQSASLLFFDKGVERRRGLRSGEESSMFGLPEISQVLGARPSVVEDLVTAPGAEDIQCVKIFGRVICFYPHVLPSGELLSVGSLEKQLGRSVLFRSSDQVVFEGRTFFDEPMVKASCWRDATEEPWRDAVGLNYLDQTSLLCEYASDRFRGSQMPEVFLAAIDEFNSKRFAIQRMMKGGSSKKAAEELVSLSVNRLFRETAGQVIYRLVVDQVINRRYLLDDVCVWTRSLSDNGSILRVGFCRKRGILIGQAPPFLSSGDTSLCVSTEIGSGS